MYAGHPKMGVDRLIVAGGGWSQCDPQESAAGVERCFYAVDLKWDQHYVYIYIDSYTYIHMTCININIDININIITNMNIR